MPLWKVPLQLPFRYWNTALRFPKSSPWKTTLSLSACLYKRSVPALQSSLWPSCGTAPACPQPSLCWEPQNFSQHSKWGESRVDEGFGWDFTLYFQTWLFKCSNGRYIVSSPLVICFPHLSPAMKMQTEVKIPCLNCSLTVFKQTVIFLMADK